MKAKQFLIISMLVFATLACGKNDDVGGTEEISGTLFYRNTLSGVTDSIKIPNSELFIQFKERGTNSYLYKVLTDADGKFTFTNLKKNEHYYIFKNWEKDNIKYMAKDIIPPGKKDAVVILMPDETSQNGFQLTVIDTLSPPTPISNFKLWVFTNKVLADNNDTAGYIFSLKTNDYGNVYRLGIQPGTYYINAKDSSGNIRLKGKVSITVPNPGISKDNFVLRPF